jgi:small subunit ribosomal protein S20
MPITKSAVKAAKQSKVRQSRLLPYKTNMRTMMRKLRDAVKEGKKEDAQKLLATAYKSIDMAAKKKIIHRRNADRKKASMAKLLAGVAK